MFSSPFSDENERDLGVITLTDEQGRSLECYLEDSLLVEGKEYFLLLPKDSPVEFFISRSEGKEEVILLEDDTIVDQVFSTAQAVLAEQNLELKYTAYSLTVVGDLPPVEESEIFNLEIEDEEEDLEPEQLQLLAKFYHDDQEYTIYTPLDPLLFFAQKSPSGTMELLSPEEFRKFQPLLEEYLFNEVD